MKLYVLSFLFLLFCLPLVSADFYFSGYVYNTTGSVINGTNVTLNVYVQPSITPNITFSMLVNDSTNGFFNMTINSTYQSGVYSFRPILRYFNGTTVDYVGQNLPDFPYSEFSQLGSVKFYLQPGATINLSAVNGTNASVPFMYMVKDTKFGYPLDSSFSVYSTHVAIHVPVDRNYTVMIYPQQSFPIGYVLNNITSYAKPRNIGLVFNTTNTLRRVSGNITSGNTAGFESFRIANYLYESGNMVSQDHPLPYNISAWAGGSDIYDNNTGFYNISLPGAAMEAKIMMLVVAKNNTGYYGSIRNITLNYSNNEIPTFNFVLSPLLGTLSNISLDTATGGNFNITANKVPFNITDGQTGAAINSAHIEMDLDYSTVYANGSVFTWMADLSPTTSTLTFPLINASVKKMNIYSGNYGPKKTSFTSSQLLILPVAVNLTGFMPGEIDVAEQIAEANLEIAMFRNNDTCSVPYPPADCSLLNATQFDQFNPLTVIIGGGKLDFMMRLRSNNITVKFMNVDLIASGPPDALFDSSANDSAQGASLGTAWRFGSMGPEIYDYVLVGIPYNGSVDESAPINILLNNLYDENWNVIWNSTGHLGGENYSTVANGDYADYNRSWFNTTAGGTNCNTTNITALCYINTSLNMLWLKLPHFSGVGPLVQTITIGNVTLSNNGSANYPCTHNCSVYVNVTNGNFTLTQTRQNISFNNSDSLGSVVSYQIYIYNGSDWLFNRSNVTNITNYNFSLYNGSSQTVHQYRIDINKSNVTTTTWTFAYNVSGLGSLLNLQINLSCGEVWSCSDWSTCSGGTQTRTCIDSTNCGTTNYRPALSQSCTSATSSGSSGGSGSASSQVAGQQAKTIWETLKSGETAIVKVNNGEIGVTEVSFTSGKTVYSSWVQVAKKESLPSSVKSFSQKAYRYLEITKSTVLTEEVVNQPVIKFKVQKSWLTDQKIIKDNVALFRYNEDKWTELKTAVASEDSEYVHYSADTPGFSYFVIGEKAVAEPVVSKPGINVSKAVAPSVAKEEKAAAPSSAKESKSKLPFWAWLIVLAVGIALVVYLWKNKK